MSISASHHAILDADEAAIAEARTCMDAYLQLRAKRLKRRPDILRAAAQAKADMEALLMRHAFPGETADDVVRRLLQEANSV